MTNALLEQGRSLYGQISRTYQRTGYSYTYELSPLWAGPNTKAMLDIIRGSMTAGQAVHAIQSTWLFSVNSTDYVKEKAIDWLLTNQRQNNIDLFAMDEAVQESIHSNPNNNVIRSNRRLTPDFLRTVNLASEIKRHCLVEHGASSIVELGAGCGHLARTLKLLLAPKSYVILDIPESLFFSYLFLRLNFPDAKTLYVLDASQIAGRSLAEYDFVFVPTLFSDAILENQFDLFVNTASLGEMPARTIRHWVNYVENKLKVRYLFSFNRFLNTIIPGQNDWRLDENECSVLWGPHWAIRRWELEPSFTRCPYKDTIISRYLEMVAERQEPQSPSVYEERSKLLLDDVCTEDWVRLEQSFPPEMTCRDNILVNDMTQSGTLFKLWESIRLNATAGNVGWMIKYLQTLMHRQNREFEEMDYYKRLMLTLANRDGSAGWVPFCEMIRMEQRPRTVQREATVPLLIKENVLGFNVVWYGGRFFALAQELGRVDVASGDVEGWMRAGQCLVGRSLEEVEWLVGGVANAQTAVVA